MKQIPESDWKKLRALKDNALKLAYKNAMKEASFVIENSEGTERDTFKQLMRTIQAEDEKIADMFDNWRRSDAISIIMFWKSYGVISEAEIAKFSEETRKRLDY